jgi:serine/threonine protein kinase
METQKPRRIIDNKYIIKKRLGYGAQGEVFLVDKIDDNNEYVVKIINEDKASSDNKNNFMNEIEILKILSNEEKKICTLFIRFRRRIC